MRGVPIKREDIRTSERMALSRILRGVWNPGLLERRPAIEAGSAPPAMLGSAVVATPGQLKRHSQARASLDDSSLVQFDEWSQHAARFPVTYLGGPIHRARK